MKDLKVFIIILNWNRHKDTIESLKSLEYLSVKGFKLTVIVVDNGSDGKDLKYLKKFKTNKYNLNIIENGVNLGFAGGNNKGINFAIKEGADYILLLNNDTQVDDNLVAELINASNKYKDSKIFTPKIYFAKGYEFKKNYKDEDLGHVIWSFGGEIDWNNIYASNCNVDVVDRGQFENDYETDFATGAAMFLNSSVFKKYRGFNEKYFLYLEDVDLCERYKKDGGKIIAVSKAKLWHKVSQSSAIGSELNDYYITRNRLYFGMVHACLRAKLALIRESLNFLLTGRKWQKKGVVDFYTGNLYKGSWK